MGKNVIDAGAGISQPQLDRRETDGLGGESTETAPQSAYVPEAYDGPERRKELEDGFDLDEINYFPMFWASVQAAALTIIGQFFIPMYLSLQLGLNVDIRLWANILPYFAVQTDAATFEGIIFWSAIGTSVVLAAFSLIAFLPGRSLRVRFGRLFAWLDIALMGTLLLYRHLILQVGRDQEPWMWIMVAVGVLGFINGSLVVRMMYKERVEDLNA